MMPDIIPAHTRHAEPVAKIATGVGTALAAIWFPPAALAQPIIDRLIERWIRKPEEILIKSVQDGGIDALSEEQLEAFIPMAYKFFEASKQGERKNNLEMLGKFIANELKEPNPQAVNLLVAADALSGISEIEIKIFSHAYRIINSPRSIITSNNLGHEFELEPIEGVVEPTTILSTIAGKDKLELSTVEDALASLVRRSLMYPIPASDFNRPDHTGYRMTYHGELIIAKACA